MTLALVRKRSIELAKACNYEKGHAHHVTKLALKLFDELKSLHHLGDQERFLLESAALLHDIGWVKGRQGHHKTARDIIMNSENLPFRPEEKIIVALVVRYHRRALPQETHKYYADLDEESRQKICVLSAFLRTADGLDRSHMDLVEDLSCEILAGKIILKLQADKAPLLEMQVGKQKADLLEQVFKREVIIQCFSQCGKV